MFDRYLRIAALFTLCLSGLTETRTSAADRLYFGSYGGKEHAYMLKDSLKFNIIAVPVLTPQATDSLADGSLRAIAYGYGGESPTDWSWQSFYSLWEAEGFPESNVNLEYSGGTLVNDDSASGGKAMKFTSPDTAGIIQTGPCYYQYGTKQYTAEFCLKYLPDTLLGTVALSSSTPVCSIMVVDRDTIILKDTTLYKDDFGIGEGYKTFKLENYTVLNDPWTGIEFKIYWFGISGDFYIDYVKVYDEPEKNGLQVMSGAKDSTITAYVSQDWTKTVNTEGDTVIYRWYLKDEPLSIDLYMPTAHIDSLLKEVSQERVGFQAYCWYRNPAVVYEYLLRQNPTDFCVDIYPMSLLGQETTGPDYQNVWTDEYTDRLNFVKSKADSLDKDFWLVAQAFVGTNKNTDSCSYPLIFWDGVYYCPEHREPTRYEMRLQTFLGLCYGADGILYFPYKWWIDGNGNLLTGLYDLLNDSSTYKWREIRDFIGPRMEVLGPIYTPLEWQGACLDSEVGSFLLRNSQPSYIDSISSSAEPHWVQVGFFKSANNDTNYFMLVNRECVANEGANYNVFVRGVPYKIRDMYTDSIVGNGCGVGDYFTVYLGPGEGKLFRLEPRERIIRVRDDYEYIQDAIYAACDGDTVLVEPDTFPENINFLSKAITLASHFILDDHDSTLIDSTVIDGSNLSNGLDSASVVTFVSGEDSTSVLIGFTITGGQGTQQLSPGRPHYRGGGIYCYNSSPLIVNNRIINNHIPDHYPADHKEGGGICSYYNSSPRIINNLILNNYGATGGGIYIEGGSPKIVNNTLVNDSGGGIVINGSNCQLVIRNNVIVNNLNGGGINFISSPPCTVSSNDVWGHGDSNFVNCLSGTGQNSRTNFNRDSCDSFLNIVKNPRFIDSTSNYHLLDSSRCINAGDDNAPSLPAFDFDFSNRIIGCNIDMGAYEFWYLCGDANGSGTVSVADITYLINYLFQGGPPPDPIQSGDANCDGRVTIADTVYLVNYLFKGGPAPCPQ